MSLIGYTNEELTRYIAEQKSFLLRYRLLFAKMQSGDGFDMIL